MVMKSIYDISYNASLNSVTWKIYTDPDLKLYCSEIQRKILRKQQYTLAKTTGVSENLKLSLFLKKNTLKVYHC